MFHLPAVEEQLRSQYRNPYIRAELFWLRGAIYAAQAEVAEDWWEKRKLWRRSGQNLKKALDCFSKVKDFMRAKIAACAADLAAAQAREDRYKIPELLEKGAALWPQDLDHYRRGIVKWAGAREPQAVPQMWAGLHQLREETVAAGCAPALVPYMDPAEAL